MRKYYYKDENGTEHGPFSLEDLIKQPINHYTLIRHDDLTEWTKFSDIPEGYYINRKSRNEINGTKSKNPSKGSLVSLFIFITIMGIVVFLFSVRPNILYEIGIIHKEYDKPIKKNTSEINYISENKVNMRSSPNKSADIILCLNKGDQVEVLPTNMDSKDLIEEINGESYTWKNVKYLNYQGWVWDKYLQSEKIIEINPENNTDIESNTSSQSENNSSDDKQACQTLANETRYFLTNNTLYQENNSIKTEMKFTSNGEVTMIIYYGNQKGGSYTGNYSIDCASVFIKLHAWDGTIMSGYSVVVGEALIGSFSEQGSSKVVNFVVEKKY